MGLAVKGVGYEYKAADLKNKSRLLLKMNPVSKQILNGKLVTESLVIFQYIDEVWKDKSPLLPSESLQASQCKVLGCLC